MGRPKDAKERQWQRAAEDVDRALRRKDAPGAAEHLLVLPKERRQALLPQVVALFRADVQRAYAGGDLGKLSKWVVWAEMEPRLLEGQDPAVVWPLVLGAARTRDWQRAQRMFAALAPDLQQRAPGLHDWLSAWIEHRGQVPPELAGTPGARLKRLPLRAPVAAQQPDPRLGYEPSRKAAVAVFAPKSPQDAAQAVLRLFATERRPQILRDTLVAWQRQPPVKEALAVHAVPLLVREALLLRRDGRSATVPLLAIGELMPDIAPAALSGDVSLALRLSSTALPLNVVPTKADNTLEALLALIAVAGVAARYQEHRQAVVDRIVRTQLPKEAAQRALPLLRDLLARSPGPELLAKTLRLWTAAVADEDGDLPEAPDWMAQGVAQVLEQGEVFNAWLRRASATERNQLLMPIGLGMPLKLGEQVLERALTGEGHDEDSRRDLARLLASLVGRRDLGDRAEAGRQRGISPERATFGDLRDLLMELDEEPPPDMLALIFSAPPKARLPRDLWPIYVSLAMEAGQEQPVPLSRGQKGLIERFGERLVPYHPDLLGVALKQTSDEAQKLRLIEGYLAPRKDIESRLEAMRALCCPNCAPKLFPYIEERIVTEYAADAESLSRAFRRLQFFDASLQTARRIARALLDADVDYPGPRSLEYQETLMAAMRIAPRQRRTGPKAKPAKPAKAPKPAKAAKPAKLKPAKLKPAKAAAKPAKAAQEAEPKQSAAPPPVKRAATRKKGRLPGVSE